MAHAVSPQTLDRLRQYDTPTIANVIELFDVVPRNRGFMDARIQAMFPQLPPMVGFATTASFRSDAPPQAGTSYASLEQQVEQFATLDGPAVVVFQDLDDPSVSATFGEVMCSVYRGFGSAGLITSGAGRDIEQVRALNYPVFASGRICSHGYCHTLHLGLPVRVGGLVVHQGDLLHGDANGAPRVPVEIAAEVADATPEFIAAERIIMDYVQPAGDKNLAQFTERRKAFSAAVQKLAARVSRKPS